MIEVFKKVHNYYDSGAMVKLNYKPFSITKGNKFKLHKFTCHYNISKYSFCYQVVKIWNCLLNFVVDADLSTPFRID